MISSKESSFYYIKGVFIIRGLYHYQVLFYILIFKPWSNKEHKHTCLNYLLTSFCCSFYRGEERENMFYVLFYLQNNFPCLVWGFVFSSFYHEISVRRLKSKYHNFISLHSDSDHHITVLLRSLLGCKPTWSKLNFNWESLGNWHCTYTSTEVTIHSGIVSPYLLP